MRVLMVWLAERRRAAVRLNLAELNVLLDAALDAGSGRRRGNQYLSQAAERIEAARNRRLAAVRRAGAA